MKIIGFVGLPGSGKGEASSVAKQLGLCVVVMGDVIRQQAAFLGIEQSDENLGRIGCELRAEEGPLAVARRSLEMARATGSEIVVVDGLRSSEEADFFRAGADEFCLIEVCAPKEARLRWLEARGRPDDPGSWKEAGQKIISSGYLSDQKSAEALEQRECRELSWGMCEVMKAADLKLRNDGSLEEFRKNVKDLLEILAAGSACRIGLSN